MKDKKVIPLPAKPKKEKSSLLSRWFEALKKSVPVYEKSNPKSK